MDCVRFCIFALGFVVFAVVPVLGNDSREGARDSSAALSALRTAAAGSTGEANPVPPEITGKSPFIAVVGSDGIQHIEIKGGDYYFDPDHIIVKTNIPVEIRALKAKGMAPHTLIVKAPEAGIDFKLKLNADRYQTVTFIPGKPGKYEMFCDEKLPFLKSHRERGMHGVIEVVP